MPDGLRPRVILGVGRKQQTRGGALILYVRAATLDDADSVADVYLRSRKELVSGAPLVHSDKAVREWEQLSRVVD